MFQETDLGKLHKHNPIAHASLMDAEGAMKYVALSAFLNHHRRESIPAA